MSSLHVRYRPTTFDEVIGQDQTVKSLKRVIKDARAQVFLFVGPAGTGKTTLARILANSFAGGKATSANIQEIRAAENTGVDDMRTVIQHSAYRAIGASSVKTIILILAVREPVHPERCTPKLLAHPYIIFAYHYTLQN